MSSRTPVGAVQLRIALALVILEHKPADWTLANYLALLRRRAQEGKLLTAQGHEHEQALSKASQSTRLTRQQIPPQRSACSTSTRAFSTVPSQAAPAVFPVETVVSPAELVDALVQLKNTISSEEASAVEPFSAKAWMELARITGAALHLPQEALPAVDAGADVVQEEPAGMQTRGRTRKHRSTADRGAVEREIASTAMLLISRCLADVTLEHLAATLAPALPVFAKLAGFSRSLLEQLVPELLQKMYALLGTLLDPCGDCSALSLEGEESTSERDAAVLIRLAAMLSLAQFALPDPAFIAVPRVPAIEFSALRQAIDALVRLVAAPGVLAQLGPLPLGVDNVSVEQAILGLLERLWEILDTVEDAEETRG